jgi:hypothetical protein
MELLCSGHYNMERTEAAARTGWREDPIHPTNHSVAKMALHLIEKLSYYNPSKTSIGGGGGQRRTCRVRLAINGSCQRASLLQRQLQHC